MSDRKPNAMVDASGATLSRRRLFTGALHMGAAGFAATMLGPLDARAAVATARLAFSNLHTGERLTVTYRENGEPVPDALAAINHLLRDHRNGEVAEIDLGLLDLLHALARRLDSRAPFQIISGYRSPATNARLREAGRGVAKNSYHMRGMAADIRVEGVRLKDLRQAALNMKRGGVGYYPRPRFIHVDTGRVRRW